MLIHIGSNDIIPSKQHDLNVKDVFQGIVDIGLYCQKCNNFIYLIKRNFYLTRIIRQINDLLSKYCISNNFLFLTNDNISRQKLGKDGIHLSQ